MTMNLAAEFERQRAIARAATAPFSVLRETDIAGLPPPVQPRQPGLPSAGEAVWHLPEGDFVYGRFTLRSFSAR